MKTLEQTLVKIILLTKKWQTNNNSLFNNEKKISNSTEFVFLWHQEIIQNRGLKDMLKKKNYIKKL